MLDIVDMRTVDLSGPDRQPERAQRRNPRPCGPRRLGPDGTGARRVRHRPASRRRASASKASRSRSASPHDAIDRGIYLIPEDRKRSGLLLDVSITENISLPDLASYARAFLVREGAETQNAEQQRRRLRIKVPDVGRPRERAVRRQPAEGRAGEMAFDAARVSSSSTSRPAASMSARRAKSTRSCASLPMPASRS